MISFEEYKKTYYEKHPFARDFKVTDNDMMVQYYEENFGRKSGASFDELCSEKDNLKKLANDIAEDCLSGNGLKASYGAFYFIIELMLKIDGTSDVIDELEIKFIENNLKKLSKELHSSNFEDFWKNNIKNLRLRTDKIGITGFGAAEIELDFQKDVLECKYKEVIEMGMWNPGTIIDWYDGVKVLYDAKPRLLDSNYEEFYFTLLQLSILKSKELNRFDLLSKFIIEREKYLTEITRDSYKRAFRKFFLGKILGYGEKLENIVISLLVFGIIMTLIYMKVDLCGMPENAGERFVAAVYFFFTTSFTIGYGDITPHTSIARVVVMINQIVGFFLSGSLVALYLRKWFRD